MKHLFRSAMVVAGLLFGAATNAAFADSITVTGTETLYTGSSWWSPITLATNLLAGSPSFAHVHYDWLDGDQFEPDGGGDVFIAADFSSGWSEDGGSTAIHAETSRATNHTNITYSLVLDGAGDDGDFTYYAVELYNLLGKLVAEGTVRQEISSGAVDYEVNLHTVPVPAAVWTGLPMLGGMMLLVRRRRRRALA